MATRVDSPRKPDYSVLLLGAPEIRQGEKSLSLRRRQARALVYYLAHRRSPASRERLAFLFWPDRPDAVAQRNLTRLLSAVRRELDDNFLVTRPGQVTLKRQRVWTDCEAFDRLRLSSEREELEAALELCRGRFLDGFSLPASPAFVQWQDEQQRQHERRHLDLLLRLVDHCQATGDLDAAIGYARRYLVRDELAEEVHRRLITLYAANGNRSAAVRQFEACTLILERELGVRPLPETRSVYEAARQGAPPGALPAVREPLWRTLPSMELPLIGREAAWETIAAACRRLGEGGVVFIRGEPGVGKSRLMQAYAQAQEALLLVGHSGTQALPYDALVLALRLALAHPALGEGVEPIWLAETARLLPELHSRFPNLPTPIDVEPKQAQARLFAALTWVFLSLASANRTILCLDDVHWADEATLGWLHYLTDYLPGSGLLILATYRTQEVDPLRSWQRELGRAGLMATVELAGLSPSAVTAVLDHAGAHVADPGRLAGRIQAATGGNVFFVLEVVRELLETDRLGAADPDLPLPQTVQDTVLRRAGRLPPLSQQILEMAAVLSPHLQLEAMVEASGRSEMEVIEGLKALVSGQLLVADAGRFHFHHDLAREAVYRHIHPWRRRILHRRAAEGLERIQQAELAAAYDTISGAIATHYGKGGRIGKAMFYYRQAAAAARRIYALTEAHNYALEGVALLEKAADRSDYASHELDLQLLRGAILLDTEQLFDPQVEAVFGRAAELSEQLQEPLKQAHALRGLCYFYVHHARLDPGQAQAEQLLGLARALDSAPFLLEAYWNLGAIAMFRGQFTEAHRRLEQAGACYRRANVEQALIFGQPAGLACLAYMAQVKQMLGYPDQAIAQHWSGVALAEQTTHPLYTVFAMIFTAQMHHYRGNHAVALAAAEKLLAVEGDYRLSYFLAIGRLYRGWALFAGGQLEEGLYQIEQALTIMQQAPPIPGTPIYLAIAAEVYMQVGRLTEASALLDQVWTVVERTGLHFRAAELHRLQGELLRQQGGPAAEVEAHFLRAIEVARRQEARWLELKAALSLARWRQSQSRIAEARRPLAEICDWFTEGFDTAYLQAARALLAELS